MQWAVVMKKDSLRFKPSSLDYLEFLNTDERGEGHHLPCKVHCRKCGTLIADDGAFLPSCQIALLHLKLANFMMLIPADPYVPGRNMWMAFPELFRFEGADGRAPNNWRPQNHIFYGQRVFEVVPEDGVRYWEGAKENSREMTSRGKAMWESRGDA